MKKCVLFALVLAVLSSAAAAQALVENPAKPSSRNAGRVVSLKEEMRIEDMGEGFYFKRTRAIRVSPRGDIIVLDGQEQVLQFDPHGRFIRNLFKKGQGPGESLGVMDVWASPDMLFLWANPKKILIYDYAGNLLKEVSYREMGGFARFVFADAGGILFHVQGQPDPSAGTGFRDIPQKIIEITPDSASLKMVGSFPIRAFVEVQEAAMNMSTWSDLQVVALVGNSLFLNHTPEYLVENFVRDKGAIVRQFKRPYTRVKWSGVVGSVRGGSGTGGGVLPLPEFSQDIYALHVVDGKIWVQTSTVVEGKGILFDVFDPEGRYIDNFYIQSLMKDPSGKPVNMRLTIAGGFAYFREEIGDGLIIIKKCRLVGL
jgi:hypothetical protein